MDIPIAATQNTSIPPLSGAAIRYLQNRDPAIVPYQEYFTEAEVSNLASGGSET